MARKKSVTELRAEQEKLLRQMEQNKQLLREAERREREEREKAEMQRKCAAVDVIEARVGRTLDTTEYELLADSAVTLFAEAAGDAVDDDAEEVDASAVPDSDHSGSAGSATVSANPAAREEFGV